MKLFGKTQTQVNSELHLIAVENCRRLRMEAYRNESDPIFFDYQRGIKTKEEWELKVAEIKSRYPKPV